METTSCTIQESERLKKDAVDKAHRESMCDYIKIPKIAFFYDTIYLLYLSKITFILILSNAMSDVVGISILEILWPSQ